MKQVNLPPVLADTTFEITVRKNAKAVLNASDPEGQPLTYEWIEGILPTGMQFFSAGYISGAPNFLTPPEGLPIKVKVSDGTLSTVATVTLKVVNPLVLKLTPASPSLVEGKSMFITLSLNKPAPARGWLFNLGTSDTSKITVPPLIAMPAGMSECQFLVSAPATSTLGNVQISIATYTAYAASNAQTELIIELSTPQVTITQPASYNEVLHSAGTFQGTALATNGRSISSVTVWIYRSSLNGNPGTYWNGTSWISSPTQFNATGTNNWSFNAPPLDNGSYTMGAIATDSAGRHMGVARSFKIELLPSSISLSLSTPSLDEGSSAIGTVTLNQPAPAGGYTVALTSSSPVKVAVPSSVTIAQGQLSAQFGISTSSTGSPATIGSVTITAKNGGLQANASLVVNTVLPEVTITNPIVDYMVFATLKNVSGTATPRLGRSISKVSVSLYRFAANGNPASYWNGTTWTNIPTDLPASGGNNWSFALPDLLSGSYAISAIVLDSANRTATSASRQFKIEIPPTISIDDISISEGTPASKGSTGNTVGLFTLRLNNPSPNTVTVNYTTSSGTATAGTDFLQANGLLVFTPGQTSQSISVTVLGDKLVESNETFTLNLSSPQKATLADATGIGTILDDDSKVTASIADGRVVEGNSGTTNAIFTVNLSRPIGRSVSMSYATSKGTAAIGSDFNTTSGTLTFAPGETSKNIVVPVHGDLIDELDETFTLKLTKGIGVTFTRASAIGTISDDDATPSVSVEPASIIEGNKGKTTLNFTLRLSAPSSRKITVKAGTTPSNNSPATAKTDYTALSPKAITFNPGETTKTVAISIIGDTVAESNEKFNLQLTSAVAAVLGQSIAEGTILDDDKAGATDDDSEDDNKDKDGSRPELSINDITLTEGNSGTKKAIFTVKLSNVSRETITVDYDTIDATATSGSDYKTVRGSLTFVPGETSKTIEVLVYGDTIRESNEQFKLVLSNGYGAILGDTIGIATITNDDKSSIQQS